MAVKTEIKVKGKTAVTVFIIAQLVIAGLIWLVFFGSGDREGRIKATIAAAKAGEVEGAVASYYEERKALPSDNSALRLQNKQGQPYFTAFEEKGNPSYTIGVVNGVITLTFSPDQEPVSGKTLIYIPRISDGKLVWSCDTSSVDDKYLPSQCQSQ